MPVMKQYVHILLSYQMLEKRPVALGLKLEIIRNDTYDRKKGANRNRGSCRKKRRMTTKRVEETRGRRK